MQLRSEGAPLLPLPPLLLPQMCKCLLSVCRCTYDMVYWHQVYSSRVPYAIRAAAVPVCTSDKHYAHVTIITSVMHCCCTAARNFLTHGMLVFAVFTMRAWCFLYFVPGICYNVFIQQRYYCCIVRSTSYSFSVSMITRATMNTINSVYLSLIHI